MFSTSVFERDHVLFMFAVPQLGFCSTPRRRCAEIYSATNISDTRQSAKSFCFQRTALGETQYGSAWQQTLYVGSWGGDCVGETTGIY